MPSHAVDTPRPAVRGSETVSQVYWPWFVAGLLSPFVSSFFERWVAAHLAAGISFFLLFAAASSLVRLRMPATQHRFLRNVAASAAGAVVVAVLKYAFP